MKNLLKSSTIGFITVLFLSTPTFSKNKDLNKQSEKNKIVVENVYENIMNQGKFEQTEKWIEKNYVDHDPDTPAPGGIEGFKKFFTMLRKAFPDLKVKIEDIIAENDTVVARIVLTGTQKGEFMGIPPTNNKINVSAVDTLRLSKGKIVEHWGLMDTMSLMNQLHKNTNEKGKNKSPNW